MPSEFRCPSDSDAADDETSYVMVTGPNTVGGPSGSPGTRPREITDGLSSTILVVEVHGLKIPWTEPRDITLDELLARLRSGARIGHVAGFYVSIPRCCAAWRQSMTDCRFKSTGFEHHRLCVATTKPSISCVACIPMLWKEQRFKKPLRGRTKAGMNSRTPNLGPIEPEREGPLRIVAAG
jgi:hypothetical protein